MRSPLIPVFFVLLLLPTATGAGVRTVYLDDTTESVLVKNNILIYVDETGESSLAQVLQIPDERWIEVNAQMHVPRRSYKPGQKIYEKVALDNQSRFQFVLAKTGIVAKDYGNTAVFWYQKGKVTEIPTVGAYLFTFLRERGTGYLVAVKQVTKPYTSITIQPWAIQSMTFFIPTNLSWNRLNFIAMGVAISILLYNIGMFCFFRRSYFLWYCGYLAACIVILAYIQDVIRGYQSLLFFVPACASLLCLFLFKSSSLALKKHTPVLYWMYLTLTLGSIAYILVFNLQGYFAPYNLTPWFLSCVFAFFASIRRALQGYRPAIVMVVGWGFQSLGILILILNFAYLNSQDPLLLYTPTLGWSLEIVFFSFAAAYKVRLQEKAVIEENAHAFSQLRKIFYPHQIRAIRDGKHIEGTLPVGKGEACVIAFDIIGSSKVKHDDFRKTLEAFFSKCRLIMLQNYDDAKLTANAFMIK